ncbi:MAG: hypothetical protein ABIM40_02775 [Pseudomonadota bacterium]
MPRPFFPQVSGLLAAVRELHPLAHPRSAALAGRLVSETAAGPGDAVLLVNGGGGFLSLAFLAAGCRVAVAEAGPLAAFAAQTLARPLAAPALARAARAVLAHAGREMDAPPGLFPPPYAPDRLRRALEAHAPGPDRDLLALVLWAVVDAAMAGPRPEEAPLADVNLREPFEAVLGRAAAFLGTKNRLPCPDGSGDRFLMGEVFPAPGFPGFAPSLAILDLSPRKEPAPQVRRFLAPLVRGAERLAGTDIRESLEALASWRDRAAPDCLWLAVPGPGGKRRQEAILSAARAVEFHPAEEPGPAGTLVLEAPEAGVRVWVGEPEKSPEARALESLEGILSQEGFSITDRNPDATESAETPDGADLTARKGDRELLFFLLHRGGSVRISREVCSLAREDGRRLALVVAPDREAADRLRAPARVRDFPRALFLAADEISGRPDAFSPRTRDAAREFFATVEANEPAGDREDLYILRLKIPDAGDFHPGQFVMAATSPASGGRKAEGGETGQAAFLKRPFSVHRVLIPGFAPDFPRGLDLPPALARLARPARPGALDIVYRVLPQGRGTRELRRVRPGSRLALLGPLGTPANLAGWSASGIRRLHLLGGGVGIAPLVRFAQEAVFLGLDVHAFLGVDRMESLECRLPGCDPGTLPRLYVDELLSLGMPGENLRLACEAGTPGDTQARGLARENFCAGLATQPWEAALAREENPTDLAAVACGPEPMMAAAKRIADRHGVRLYVLLERRMACGLGMCMSCVCKAGGKGGETLKRVCADGPLFAARDLAWD